MSWGRSLLAAAVAGGCHALAFPPWSLAPLAWVALVPLLVALREARGLGRCLVLGGVFGVVAASLSLAWIAPTLVEGYGFPRRHAAVVYAATVTYLGAAFALFAALSYGLRRGRLPAPWCFPVAWGVVELARSELLYGLPWLALGYSQAGFLPALQLAELVGAWGLSVVLVAVNAMAAELWVARSGRTRRSTARWAIATLGVPALLLSGGELRRHQVEAWPRVDAVPVAVVQAAIPQRERWQDAEQRASHLDRYLELTRSAVAAGAQAVVWPETAIELHLDRAEGLAEATAAALGHDPARTLLAGVPRAVRDASGERFYNSVAAFDGLGRRTGLYDKVDLFPISEFLPSWVGRSRHLRRLFRPMLRWLPFTPGADDAPLALGPLEIGVLICFEVVDARRAGAAASRGAVVLLNVANDAMLSGPGATGQHFDMAVLRAVETRRPLVRASNRGVSAVIDASGRVGARLEPRSAGFRIGQVMPRAGGTVYRRWGHALPGVAVALALLALLPRRTRGR